MRITKGKTEGKGIEQIFVDCESLPPALILDGAKLSQVVLNILSNAIKFTQQGKVIVKLEWEAINTPESTQVKRFQSESCIEPEEDRTGFDMEIYTRMITASSITLL